jgi:hypothetical protein
VSRHFDDWLTTFCDYGSIGEAPRRCLFWTGVSTIAGVLRRKVWMEMKIFKWTPNFYILLVAPPGIVSKSTTIDIGMDLLSQVTGVKFGPDVVTWQSLIKSLAESGEAFEYEGEWITMSPVTIAASELGNLLNPQDREMIDVFVTLWDSRKSLRKMTKMSGNDHIINPWVNLIGCTTPAWISGNVPEYMIGGGLTSRFVLVYSDKKEKLVPYPDTEAPMDWLETGKALLEDLEHINKTHLGEYKLSEDAREWGKGWYAKHYDEKGGDLGGDDRFSGYIARKQTHIHKLAMVLSASQRDQLVIEAGDLQIANEMVSDLEADMPHVFSKVGRTESALHVERFIAHVQRNGAIPYTEAFKYLHMHFPSGYELENVIAGVIKSGFMVIDPNDGKPLLKAVR